MFGGIPQAFHWKVPGIKDIQQCIGFSYKMKNKFLLPQLFMKDGVRRLHYLPIIHERWGEETTLFESGTNYILHISTNSFCNVLIYTKLCKTKNLWGKFKVNCTLLFETLPKENHIMDSNSIVIVPLIVEVIIPNCTSLYLSLPDSHSLYVSVWSSDHSIILHIFLCF